MHEQAAQPAGDDGAKLAWLALATGLLPLVVVHACYVISAQAGLVPACIPYVTGCTSISAAGRHGVAFFLFKGAMIPAAVLLAAYWWLARRWLHTLGCADSRAVRTLVVLGVISAACLVLYVVYLGSKGDFYNLMRRFGVNVHLSFGALAQMLLVRELLRAPGVAVPRWVVRAQAGLLALLLALGLASIPLGNFVADKDRAMNVIEWWFAALTSGWYLLGAAAWQASGFHARFGTQNRAGARRGRA